MKKSMIIMSICLLFAVSFIAPVSARDYTTIYSNSTLSSAARTYSQNLQDVWQYDLKGRLVGQERVSAAGVGMALPTIGRHRYPLDFYADSSARKITIPIMSVKFFDDISIAMAWMERNSCNMMLVSDYVGMLGYQENSSFPGGRYPEPLSALGVPENALNDHYVNDVSGKALKSGIFFLMAHELAHVLYRHQGYDKITAGQAQQQEIEADHFALNLMRRISVPPVGMVIFFMIASRFESAPGDFDSIADYESHLRQQSTHPLTSARLISIADYIRDHAHDFTRGQQQPAQWYPRIISISEDIRQIGSTLDDPRIRELQRRRSIAITTNNLKNACR